MCLYSIVRIRVEFVVECVCQCSSLSQRIARAVNGEIVSDSESDHPKDYVHLQDSLSEKGNCW